MLMRPAVGRRGPGLLRAVARTAVVAGTATATANAVNDRRARRQESTQEQAQPQATAQQQAAAAAPAGSGSGSGSGSGNDLTAKLKQLADLHAAGALSDAEFAAAKAKLLGT